MKLVINARFLTQKLTGVQRYALQCSLHLIRMADEVVFVAPDAVLYPEIAAALNVRIIGRLKGHLWEQIELYDFVRSNGNPPLLNLANTAPLRYHNNYLTIHDLAFIHYPQWNSALFARWYRFLVPRLARRAAHLFTVSDTIKEDIQCTLGIDSSAITVTYNGIASEFLHQQRSVPKKKHIITVGTFNPRKGHDKILHAFLESGLAASYSLLIIGSREEIFRQTTFKEIPAGVQIITRPDDDSLIKLYQEAEILVSLSAYEGFGLPVLEALYFGCKVLCSDIPAYRELFDKYVYFCDPANGADIVARLVALSKHQFNKNLPAGLFEKYNYGCSANIIRDTIFGRHA